MKHPVLTGDGVNKAVTRHCWKFPLVGVLLLALLLQGCAGYHVGPTGGQTAGARSIQVDFFHNKTLEPRLSTAVASALRKAIQFDGTYHLNTTGTGDVVVTGTISQYERAGLSFQPRDVLTIRDYSVVMVVDVLATERATGKKLLQKTVQGKTLVRISNDMVSSERQALTVLAEDFARNATSLLTEGQW
jgi:hypothetical protein